MIPRSAQSSLSHWTITRPGMLAGSRGTTSSSRPWAITIPPECWPRCRGRSWISSKSRAKSAIRRQARSSPARSSRLSSVSSGSTYSKLRMCFASRSTSSTGMPSTLPISREALRSR